MFIKIKVILPLIDEFYCDFSTRDNISYGNRLDFLFKKLRKYSHGSPFGTQGRGTFNMLRSNVTR